MSDNDCWGCKQPAPAGVCTRTHEGYSTAKARHEGHITGSGTTPAPAFLFEAWAWVEKHRGKRYTGPMLTDMEARLVYELTRGPASIAILASALGGNGDARAERSMVGAAIQRVRVKFGADAIEAVPGVGYKLKR